MKQNLHSVLLQKMRESIEEDLRASLVPLQNEYGTEMVEMIAHHLGWNENDNKGTGKRIRPLLTLLSCGALGGEWAAAVPIASAVELIHNFSLVHDDIEDNSATRRGRPTIWKQWGVPKAINLGDSLFVLSRMASYRLNLHKIPPHRIVKVLEFLDDACLELTIGQQLDLSFEEIEIVGLETYLRMIQGKTSALIAAATTCGGMIAGAPDAKIEILSTYGHHLGLAFQIRDDILGIWGETSITGKPTNDDLLSRKKTLPILFGLNESQRFKELWEIESVEEEILLAMREALETSRALPYCIEKVELHTKSALSALNSLNGKEPFQSELTHLTDNLLNRAQ
jgi:geranylgeranyl diphosphate synthase type I